MFCSVWAVVRVISRLNIVSGKNKLVRKIDLFRTSENSGKQLTRSRWICLLRVWPRVWFPKQVCWFPNLTCETFSRRVAPSVQLLYYLEVGTKLKSLKFELSPVNETNTFTSVSGMKYSTATETPRNDLLLCSSPFNNQGLSMNLCRKIVTTLSPLNAPQDPKVAQNVSRTASFFSIAFQLIAAQSKGRFCSLSRKQICMRALVMYSMWNQESGWLLNMMVVAFMTGVVK